VIVIYRKNVTDPTVDKKYAQLRGFGFSEVYIYSGGLFEWLLLSDIYGVEEFPLSSSSWAKSKILDPLKYKPPATFARLRLENGRRV
jgi:hypothetical protein